MQIWFMWLKTICISTQNLLLSQGDKVVTFCHLFDVFTFCNGNNFCQQKELHVEKNPINLLTHRSSDP